MITLPDLIMPSSHCYLFKPRSIKWSCNWCWCVSVFVCSPAHKNTHISLCFHEPVNFTSFYLLTLPENFTLAETHHWRHSSRPRLHPKELMTNTLKLTQDFLLHTKSICIYKVLHYAAEPVIKQLLGPISKSSEMQLRIMATAATQRPVGIWTITASVTVGEGLLHTPAKGA